MAETVALGVSDAVTLAEIENDGLELLVGLSEKFEHTPLGPQVPPT